MAMRATKNTGASQVHRNSSRETTETKSAYKTTELIIYVLAVLGVLIDSLMVSGAEGNPDPFGAEQAWRYVTYLTIGYLISRGLAKSGSRKPYRD